MHLVTVVRQFISSFDLRSPHEIREKNGIKKIDNNSQ